VPATAKRLKWFTYKDESHPSIGVKEKNIALAGRGGYNVWEMVLPGELKGLLGLQAEAEKSR